MGKARLIVLSRRNQDKEKLKKVEAILDRDANRSLYVGEMDIHAQTNKAEYLAETLFYINGVAKNGYDNSDGFYIALRDHFKKQYAERGSIRGIPISEEKAEEEFKQASIQDDIEREPGWKNLMGA